MPSGKGTYGSKRGRPKKKRKVKGRSITRVKRGKRPSAKLKRRGKL